MSSSSTSSSWTRRARSAPHARSTATWPNTALLADVLHEESIEGVIHFAGRKFVAESMRDPGRYFRVNTAGSLSVLEAMVAAGTPHIVFCSSCTVYGTPDTNPVTEDAALRPENPYGTSKLMVEQMLRWYGQVHGIRSLSLRYFNAAGASFDAALGEHFDKTLMLIPMLMQATLGLRGPVDIYGTDYPTPDGTAIRDYIHVVDLVDAHIRALEAVASQAGAAVLNLGTGRGLLRQGGHRAHRGGHGAPGPGPLGRPPARGRRRGLGGPEQRPTRAGLGSPARPASDGRDSVVVAFVSRGEVRGTDRGRCQAAGTPTPSMASTTGATLGAVRARVARGPRPPGRPRSSAAARRAGGPRGCHP